MSIRTFTDARGRVWRVWSTEPSNREAVAEEFRGGWLTFESDGERRRLRPLPTGWELYSDERLDLACRVAVPSASRALPSLLSDDTDENSRENRLS